MIRYLNVEVVLESNLTAHVSKGTMDKLRFYYQVSQIYIMAANRLTGMFFNYINGIQIYHGLSSGLCEAQVALFIPRK